jgi:hypothetical protein
MERMKRVRIGTGKKQPVGAILYNQNTNTYMLVMKRGLKVIPKQKIIRLVMDQQFPVPAKGKPFVSTQVS